MRYGTAAVALLSLLVPATAASQSETVRVVGEVRARGEAERTAVIDTIDSFALLRSRIGVEALLSERATVFLQLQDARTFGEESNTADGSADRLDLHQGWLQYRLDAGTYGISVRAGRQEVVLGNERLVGAVGWSNTGRAFDGVRVTVGPREAAWRVHGFAATVSERGRRLTGETGTDDHLFGGAFLQHGALDLYVLHDREAVQAGAASGIDRTTLGGRITSPAARSITASLEGAYQVGNQLRTAGPVAQDIGAYLLGARVAYATAMTLLPRVGVGIDVLSGDDDPGDDTYGAFNTLYATNHKFYGYIDLFLDPAARTRDRGLVDGMASARIGLSQSLALDIDAHGFWLQQEHMGASERQIGWELDLTMPVQLGPGQQLQLGYSAFRNGAAAPLIGLGGDRDLWHWAYIQATFTFGGGSKPIL